jgi:multiple sugar transport system substrate-binding protein
VLGTWLALTFAVAVAGCAASNPTPEWASISFSYGSFDPGDRGNADFLSTQLQEFQKSHPNISVDLQRSRDASTDCFTGLASNLSQQRERGEILVLDPFVEQDDTINMADFYPAASGLFVNEGETLGIPAGANMIVMYYNQDLFDRYSVPYPEMGWTWGEFLAKGLALRDPDAQVFGYVIPQGSSAFDPALFVYQHGGRIFDDLQNPTQATFDDPLTIEALEWYQQLINEHNIAPTSEQIRATYGAAENALYRGILQNRFGMWMGWFSERGGLAWPIAWPMRWGMVQLPRDMNSFTGGLVEGYFISGNSDNPQACWELISYLSHQVPYSSFPVRRSIAESDVYNSRVGHQVAAVGRASLQDALLLSPEAFAGSDALEIFGKAIDDVIQRRATVEEAMIAAQSKAEASSEP